VKTLRNLSQSATVNHPSKFTSRVIATVLPFTDQGDDTKRDINDEKWDEFQKELKTAECLQESGIFEETEYNTQGTQTVSINLDPLTGEFHSPFETAVVGDLSAEIQKLTQFRERVEEAGNCCGNKKLLRAGEIRGDDPPTYRKELEYCYERVQLLEDKVGQSCVYPKRINILKCTGSIRSWTFSDKLSDCQFLRKDSALWNVVCIIFNQLSRT